MTAPRDRVRVFKLESPASGGTQDDGGFQALANPNQDAISILGIFFQKPKDSGDIEEDELVYMTRNTTGKMVFRDEGTGAEYLLEDLVSSGWRKHFLLMGA
jgi:hypothetical protein